MSTIKRVSDEDCLTKFLTNYRVGDIAKNESLTYHAIASLITIVENQQLQITKMNRRLDYNSLAYPQE
jgi:hypothetical protein